MRARTAHMDEAAAIHHIIAQYARQGLLLERAEEEIRAHIDHFLVLTEPYRGGEKVLGCVALEPYGPDLSEIRSLAVAPDARGQGRSVGNRLMRAAIDAARERKIVRLFAVTHRPEFFSRHGFTPGPRQAVPEKIARDCVACPKEHNCTLVAMVAVVCPERDLLPVLGGTGRVLSIQ